MPRHIFHLSIPVADLEAASASYVSVLGASLGRRESDWLDILLWGHQITLQQRPEEVLPASNQGKRHFGVVLPWETWEAEARRLTDSGITFASQPVVEKKGTPGEQAKFYLLDPSYNVIEIKAYRDVSGVLGVSSHVYGDGA